MANCERYVHLNIYDENKERNKKNSPCEPTPVIMEHSQAIKALECHSYIENGKQWTACHECIYGGNGDKSCDIGKYITCRNVFRRGCWSGGVIEKIEKKE